MRVLCLTHEHDGPAGLFADVVRERGDELLEWNVSQGPPPEVPESFDALVVFGGSMHVDQEDRHPWLTSQHDLMRAALDRGQPLMGVCLGGQLLARVAGAHVGPASRPEIGWFEIELTPEGASDPVVGALPERFEAFEWHSYAFDVPPGGVLLAETPGLRAGLPRRRGGLGSPVPPRGDARDARGLESRSGRLGAADRARARRPLERARPRARERVLRSGFPLRPLVPGADVVRDVVASRP